MGESGVGGFKERKWGWFIAKRKGKGGNGTSSRRVIRGGGKG